MELNLNESLLFNQWEIQDKHNFELGRPINCLVEVDHDRVLQASNKDIFEASFTSGDKSKLLETKTIIKNAHSSTVSSLCYLEGKYLLISGGFDGNINVWCSLAYEKSFSRNFDKQWIKTLTLVSNINENASDKFQLKRLSKKAMKSMSTIDETTAQNQNIEPQLVPQTSIKLPEEKQRNLMLVGASQGNTNYVYLWDYEDDYILKKFDNISQFFSQTEYLSAIAVDLEGNILMLDLEDYKMFNLSEISEKSFKIKEDVSDDNSNSDSELPGKQFGLASPKKEKEKFRISGNVSRVAYSCKDKTIFIGDYDGYISSFKLNHQTKRLRFIKSKKLSGQMINDMFVIEEENFPAFLIARSDRSVILTSNDFERIYYYDFSNEISTCNGLHIFPYNKDTEKFYENCDDIVQNSIERVRNRFQVLMTSKSKGGIMIKKIRYIGMIEIFLIEKTLKETYEMPHALLIEFIMWYLENKA